MEVHRHWIPNTFEEAHKFVDNILAYSDFAIVLTKFAHYAMKMWPEDDERNYIVIFDAVYETGNLPNFIRDVRVCNRKNLQSVLKLDPTQVFEHVEIEKLNTESFCKDRNACLVPAIVRVKYPKFKSICVNLRTLVSSEKYIDEIHDSVRNVLSNGYENEMIDLMISKFNRDLFAFVAK
jgi:hypothetical protein